MGGDTLCHHLCDGWVEVEEYHQDSGFEVGALHGDGWVAVEAKGLHLVQGNQMDEAKFPRS